MPTEEPTRKFNPSSVPGLSTEARKAVNATFEAMSSWRTETVNTSERGIEQVIEKMAEAARALGWPKQIVDATEAQMLDRIMDAWEEQLKSPNPSAMLSKLKSLPSFGSASSWPSADAFQKAAMNPFQVYTEFTAQCQKAWTDAAGLWMRGGKPLSS